MCNALLFHQLRLFLLLAHVSFLHLHCMSEESSDLRNRVHECSSFLPLFLDEAALVLYYCTCVTWLQYQTLVSSFFLSFFLSFFSLFFWEWNWLLGLCCWYFALILSTSYGLEVSVIVPFCVLHWYLQTRIDTFGRLTTE